MRTPLLIPVLFLLALTPASGLAQSRAATTEEAPKLVVVVAKGSPIKSLSRNELRRAFLGESISSHEIALVPFNWPPGTPPRIGFDRAVLDMSPDEVGRFWVDRKVRGQSPAPRSLPSLGHVVKVVAKFPGAISYLPANQLTAAVQPVAVDGVPHTDARYTIRVPR